MSWAAYQGAARELVHLLKFQGIRPVAKFFALALSELPLPDVDAIVPMPLGPGRLRQRGFNQALDIARHLGQARALPVIVAGLRRRRETHAQTGLTQEQRVANVRGAFIASPAHDIRRRRLLLLDDVLTTGATARSAAQALVRAGAGEVHVVTVARADLIGRTAPRGAAPGKEVAA